MTGVNDSEAFDMISRIIERSRLALALPPLRDRDLVKTADAWLEIIGKVPAHRLNDCYIQVMQERQIRTPLQPAEILQAWRLIAGNERKFPFIDPQHITDNTYKCLHCYDQGYQHARVDRGEGYWSICARPCICDAAPASQRSERPVGELQNVEAN